MRCLLVVSSTPRQRRSRVGTSRQFNAPTLALSMLPSSLGLPAMPQRAQRALRCRHRPAIPASMLVAHCGVGPAPIHQERSILDRWMLPPLTAQLLLPPLRASRRWASAARLVRRWILLARMLLPPQMLSKLVANFRRRQPRLRPAMHRRAKWTMLATFW